MPFPAPTLRGNGSQTKPDLTGRAVAKTGRWTAASISFAVWLWRLMELFDQHFSKAFIGVRGVAAAYGITNRVGDRIPAKQFAIQRAREVIVVADGSKLPITQRQPPDVRRLPASVL
jgi:translation initiation factor 2B subunit (eIF-2B alpha/beta/delta family)